MSFTSYKKDKLLMENWRKFLKEAADPAAMDTERFPTKLSDVAADIPDAQDDVSDGVKDGKTDDDTIGVQPSSWSVSELGPSQSTMNVQKAVGMALGMIIKGKAGGKLGAFISKDGRIMDGHHRWISSYMVDPGAEVGGYAVEFPAAQLIPVLNAITVGKIGRMTGKEGKGSFADFNAEKIGEQPVSLYKNGNKFTTPEQAQAAIKKFSGADGAAGIKLAAQKMADNLKTANFTTPEGAPERIDMPVIDKEHVKNAIALLQKGYVDVNEPYGNASNQAKPEATKGDVAESIRRRRNK